MEEKGGITSLLVLLLQHQYFLEIVYASCIPPRPHEALRLGGFEEGRGRCLEKSIIIIVILQNCNIEILKEWNIVIMPNVDGNRSKLMDIDAGWYISVQIEGKLIESLKPIAQRRWKSIKIDGYQWKWTDFDETHQTNWWRSMKNHENRWKSLKN